MNNGKEHIVAQCTWQSSFDSEEKAHELQNKLSQWSESVLPQELQSVFNSICPNDEIWRFDEINLDLGELDYDNLEFDLSLKFQKELRSIFNHLLLRDKVTSEKIIREQSYYLKDTFEVFLISGILPWWYHKSDGTIHQIYDRLLDAHKCDLEVLVKKTGKNDKVRKRLVYQFSEDQNIKLLEILEPFHANEIIDIKQNIETAQKKNQVVRVYESSFKQQLWLWIFEHLLVERGTLFNTIQFVQCTIKQMAQKYNLEYTSLLQIIVNAVNQIEHTSPQAPVFINALKILNKNQLGQIISVSKKNEDYYEYFTELLNTRKKEVNINERVYTIQELFLELSIKGSKKLKSILTSKGNNKSVRKSIIESFNKKEIAVVFEVLAPNNNGFVMKFLDSTQSVINQTKTNQSKAEVYKAVTEVILTYLMVDRGSYFNKKSFIKESIKSIGEDYKITYTYLLYLLISSQNRTDIPLNTELLIIIKELINAINDNELVPDLLNNAFKTSTNEIEKSDVINGYLIPELLSKSSVSVFRILSEIPNLQNNVKFWQTLNRSELYKLLNLNNRDFSSFIKSLTKLIIDNNNKSGFINIYGDVKTTVPKYAVIYILDRKNRSIDLYEFLNYLFHKLSVPKSNVQLYLNSGLFQVLKKYSVKKGINTEGESYKNDFSKSDAELAINNRIDIFEWLYELSFNLNEGKTKPASYLELLRSYKIADQSKKLEIVLDSLNNSAKKKVLNQLFNGAHEFLSELKNPFLQILKLHNKGKTSEFYSKQLDLIIWSFALRNNHHKNNKQLLLGSILKAVGVQFNIPNKQLSFLIAENNDTIENFRNNLLEVFNLQEISQNRLHEMQKTISVLEKKCLYQIKEILDLISQLNLNEKQREILHQIIRKTIKVSIETGNWGHFSIQSLVNGILQKFEKSSTQQVNEIVEVWLKPDHSISYEILKYIQDWKKRNDKNVKNKNEVKGNKAGWLQNEDVVEISISWIQTGTIDIFMQHVGTEEIVKSIPEILKINPDLFLKGLKNRELTGASLDRLYDSVTFNDFIHALAVTTTNITETLRLLADFYKAVAKLKNRIISQTELQEIIYRKTIRCFENDSWNLLKTSNFLNEIIWELINRYHLKKDAIIKMFSENQLVLPQKLRNAFFTITNQNNGDYKMEKKMEPNNELKLVNSNENDAIVKLISIPIVNAGLVLMQGYFEMLFSRLGLLTHNEFSSDVQKKKAIHFLQYLVTGQKITEENYLVLNKLLCGYNINEPVETSIDFKEPDIKIMDGLIKAMIKFWPSNGSSSMDGFRGNWLVRDGVLSEKEDRWDLVIEKRAYDILLQQSPFSFSIIKFKWMNKPLYVTWNY